MDFQQFGEFPLHPGASETTNQDNKVRNNVENMYIDVQSTPGRSEDEIDMSGIVDPELRTRFRAMMESRKPMWVGMLGEIVATRLLILIKPGSVPKRQMPYRQRLSMRDATSKQISQQLEAGVIETSTS